MKLLNRFKPTRKKVVSFTTTLLGISLSGLAFLQLTANRAKADTLIGFNEGNGSTVYDENGNATGKITGATWKTEDLCVVGNCLYFDGSDWISFGDDADYDFVAAVKDGTTGIYLYIDGIQVASDTTIGSIGDLTNNDTFYIGDSTGADGGDEYIGFLDEVKIYTTSARTETEIKSDIAGATADRGTSASFGPDNTYLSDGLVGYWKMDDSGIDAEGETSTDSSGNGNNGILYGDDVIGDNGTGMDCTAASKFGTGCNLDNTDDYVEIANNSSWNNMGKVTYSAWVKPTAVTGTDSIMASRDGVNNGGYDLDHINGVLRWSTRVSGGGAAAGGTITAGVWNHIAGTF